MGLSPLFLAIDAGNSKTDLVLADLDGRVVQSSRGAGFVPTRDEASAIEQLRRQICELAVGAQGRPIVAMGLFLANVDLPEQESRLEKIATSWGLADRVHVANDTFALLRSGTAAPVGAAVVCGAGINAVGVGREGRIARFPALGTLTGDWGGGLGLAEAAVGAACRAEDGRGPATALASALAVRFDRPTAQQVGIDFSVGRLPRHRLHEAVPVLFQVANTGDRVAIDLVDRQAREVVVLAAVCLARVDLLTEPAEVVLGGGVLASRPEVLIDRVLSGLAANAPLAHAVFPTQPPLFGAAVATLEWLTGVAVSPAAAQRLASGLAGEG